MPLATRQPNVDASLAMRRSIRRAGLAAGAILLVLYSATAATAVTFWDAGEFLAAFHTWGIPHPPGTPLFVLLGRAATLALPFAGPVTPGSLLSAATTAVAGVLTARLVARWTGSGVAGIGAALCAGATASVWLNATETEVYAPALCLAILALAVADRIARDERIRERAIVLLAYLFGLAVPLHLSAIVAAPAVALLAAGDVNRAIAWRRLTTVVGLAIVAIGAGSVSPTEIGIGVLIIAGAAISRDRSLAIRSVAALALGLTAVLVLLLRARHDPALDQGNPATWRALADVIARRQYAVAPLWPRQTPWWLQIANIGQWADWQFGLGLNAQIEPSAARLTATISYLLLGIIGARRLCVSAPRAWRATAVLLIAGTFGVAAMLNLKAGPSLGWGVLPDGAPHEARERDYFFVLAFWTWGTWSGLGATVVGDWIAARFVGLTTRRRAIGHGIGIGLAALPIALNWRAVTRRHMPDAALPRAFADALLESAPSGAVMLAIGDNDTYPVWYLQHAEHVRRDVIPVTIPLLGAPWYRGELARRHELLPHDADTRWIGLPRTLRGIADAAHQTGRPLVASIAVPDSLRLAIGGAWTLRGMVWLRTADAATGWRIDTVVTARIARRIDARLLAAPRAGGDGVAEWTQDLLRCPSQALARMHARPVASLDAICKRK